MKLPLTAPNKVPTVHLYLFYSLALLLVLSAAGAFLLEEYLLLGLPLVAVMGLVAFFDYRNVYYLLFFSIPISTELYLGSFGTDFPAELLAVAMMLIVALVFLSRPQLFPRDFLNHPLTFLILVHWLWTAITVLFAEDFGVAFKFWLAKTWYISAFFLATGLLVKGQRDWRWMMWLVVLPLTLATLKVLLHHALLGFSFTGINDAVRPFFRNHVNYAAILALILPLLWFLRQLYRPFSFMWLLVVACMFICFLGVVFAYTRAAYVALILAFMAYIAIRLRLLAWAMGAAVVMVLGLSVYVVQKNKFLDYAPTERTIAHKEFDDLVAATYSFEDVSTMERYYRWIAGVRMGMERPITGFGPNGFYPHYRRYTLNKFETYISDNQERSGIHNYFLMLWVEQGIPGMLLFIFLSLGALWYGQNRYHQCPDPLQRKILMATLLSLVVINAFLLMNDLIETEKIGSFFFFHLAILVSIGRFKDGD